MFLAKLGVITNVFGVTDEEELQRVSNVLQVRHIHTQRLCPVHDC